MNVSGAPASQPEPLGGVRYTVVLAIPSRGASLQGPGPFRQAGRSVFRSVCALGAAGTERWNSSVARELPAALTSVRKPHLLQLSESGAELGVVHA